MMEKRSNKKTASDISLLGFGMMRLPRIDPEKQDIDYEAADAMVDYAYQNGVNYFDTAYVYHDGLSEAFTGHTLARYPRESVHFATKMPSWEIKSPEDGPRIFAEQLKRLQVDYIDYYLCHAIGGSWEDFEKAYIQCGTLDYLIKMKAEGKIRQLGFSFHGPLPIYEKLVNFRDWDFVQIQLNYLDWDMQNAKRLYELLEEKGIPCIVMEPVKGGNLATLCKEAVDILKAAEPENSTASWAVRFAASLPNVLTVLSGMSNMEQVTDNVKTMTSFKPLDDAGLKTLQNAVATYLDLGTIPCTGCRYCMDCPSGVDIPKVFETYNKCAAAHMLPVSFGDAEASRDGATYFANAMKEIPAENRASNCTDCKVCVEHCPQSIKIPGRMSEIAELCAGLGL